LTGGSPAGGTYSGNGVSNNQFSPLVTGAGSFLINYTYTDVHGCNDDDTSNIVVNTLPSVGLSNLTPVCQNFGPVTLSGGTPAGGVYSGPGVGGGIFYSGIAGPGQHTITYTYSNSNNCTNSSTETMTVHAAPDPDLGPDLLVCDDASVTLTGGAFSSYAWSIGGNTQSITIDSSGYGYTTVQILLTVTNSNGCANRDTIRITFDPCNGINDISEDNSISIFPNPSSDNFTFTTDDVCDVHVYDSKGSLVYESKDIRTTESFGSNLQSGYYIVRVRKNSIDSFKMILKQ
jgi:hypothetical protein